MKSFLFVGLAVLSLVQYAGAACAGAYGQCGGQNFQGSKCCISGYTCVAQNQWYSQCKPGGSSNNNASNNNNNNNNNNWNNNNNNNSGSYPKGSNLQFYTKCKNPKHWAMTYDDGPTQYADAILDLLKQKGVKATFFVLGKMYMDMNSSEWTRIVKRMYNEGHTVGSHTFSHSDLTKLSYNQIVNEMKQLETGIQRAIGKKPAFMRPPYGSGNGNQTVMSALKAAGYTAAITWNVDPQDYSNGGNINYAKQVINQAKGKGGIITLNHLKYGGDSKQGILNLASAIIDQMKANGYTPVNMEQCLGMSAYQ